MFSEYGWPEAAKERHEALLREAEQSRLIRQARAAREDQDSLYKRGLAWVGGQMVALGERLEARYGEAAPASSIQHPNPC